MKRLSGFSLMEMMTVLLIVSIVAAATAPMINKKMMASRNVEAGAGGGGCLWQDVGNGNIAFNSAGNKVTAIIGDSNYDNKNSTPRMYIKSDSNTPFIDFEVPATKIFPHSRFSLFSNGSNIGITSANAIGNSSIAIGNNAYSDVGAVAIGADGTSASGSSVAIGNTAQTLDSCSIAIGKSANAGKSYKDSDGKTITRGEGAIAIGYKSKSAGNKSIAIGYDAGSDTGADPSSVSIGERTSSGWFGIAIGCNALASGGGIAIGSKFDCITNNDAEEKNDSVFAGDYAIAIGGKTFTDEGSIAIGYKARATGINKTNGVRSNPGEYSIAIGEEAEATQKGAVAIG